MAPAALILPALCGHSGPGTDQGLTWVDAPGGCVTQGGKAGAAASALCPCLGAFPLLTGPCPSAEDAQMNARLLPSGWQLPGDTLAVYSAKSVFGSSVESSLWER